MDTQPKMTITSIAQAMVRLSDTAVSHQAFLITLAVGGLLVYGMELFNFTLSIDEELWGENTDTKKMHLHWLKCGRWIWYLLSSWIIPYPILPTIPFALGLATYSIGFFVILHLWRSQFSLTHTIAGLLMLVYPTLIYILSFSMCYGVGLCFLFAAVGMVLLEGHNSRQALIAAGVCYAGAMASYQSLVFVVPVIFIVTTLGFALNRSECDLSLASYFFPRLGKLCLAMLIGAVIYYTTWRVLLWLNHETPYYVMDTYWHPESLLDHPNIILQHVYQYVRSIYVWGDADLYAGEVKSLPILMLASTAAIILAIHRATLSYSEKVFSLLLLLSIYWVPFLLHFVNNGVMPIRSLVSLPVALAGIAFLGLISAKGAWKILLLVVSVLTILDLSIIDLRLQNSAHLALEADRAFAAQLIGRIEQVISNEKNEPSFIEFVGYHAFPETLLKVKREHIGQSFFEWDMGNTYRMAAFLKILGLRKLYPAPIEKRQSLVSMTEGLGKWPAESSVRVLGDTVVVKLSDYSLGQITLLCPSSTLCPSLQ